MILIADDYAAIRAALALLKAPKPPPVAAVALDVVPVADGVEDVRLLSDIYRAYHVGDAP